LIWGMGRRNDEMRGRKHEEHEGTKDHEEVLRVESSACVERLETTEGTETHREWGFVGYAPSTSGYIIVSRRAAYLPVAVLRDGLNV